jgi:hypothetical protein
MNACTLVNTVMEVCQCGRNAVINAARIHNIRVIGPNLLGRPASKLRFTRKFIRNKRC